MNIDEQLYSRQIAAFGLDTMKKLSKLKILIYGLRGLGIELCKNIILSGPEKVTIFDDNKIKIEDLGANFYIEENDLGLRRDEICLDKLRKLNDYVICDILKDANIENHILDYDVIVLTEIMELNKIIKINDICHENKKGFIYCLVFGLTFFCFVDFGEHTIINLNNKDIKKYYIKEIVKGKNTTILIDNTIENFELYENEYIEFKEINGMPELLNGIKRKIQNSQNDSFQIDEDSSNYKDYIGGGFVQEVKEKIFFHNKTIKEMINYPDICELTNSKNNYLNLHLAFLSLHEYFKINKKLPNNDSNDLNIILNICSNIYNKNRYSWCNKINLNEEYLKDIFKYSKCQISPICGYGGGVASQEIIKFTGIYRPINQWFRAEFIGILDKTLNSDKKIYGSRYDEQILIFGNETQKKIEDLNLFLIGAGAVGCELLKYFAMMGISTNNNSLLSLSEHDRIEKSNLNRQFLFSKNDILKLKGECAINSARKMNNKTNFKFYNDFVCKETENQFNKEFFEKQNAVVMAVDNFETRNYISQQCEKYKIPYFNCGTEGPYANVEAFIPGITVEGSYPSNFQDIVPTCTLKMFPYSINHCVIWSINNFEKYFNQNIKNINFMLKNINQFFDNMNKIGELRKRLNTIKKIFKLLKISNSKNFHKCIKYSINKYYKLFIYKINDLLSFYPPEYIVEETGKKFWIGNKKMPNPLKFDVNEEQCFGFVKSFSCLLAYCLNINISKINIDEEIKNYCNKEFKLKKPSKKLFEKTENYKKKLIEIKEKINSYLKNESLDKINKNEIIFEKDSSNIHELNFIFYSSNLRAKNYSIEQEDSTKIKIIAGKIVPALITSTSAIGGILALQLYVICQKKNYRNFRTGMIDLSDNTLALGIPESIKHNIIC